MVKRSGMTHATAGHDGTGPYIHRHRLGGHSSCLHHTEGSVDECFGALGRRGHVPTTFVRADSRCHTSLPDRGQDRTIRRRHPIAVRVAIHRQPSRSRMTVSISSLVEGRPVRYRITSGSLSRSTNRLTSSTVIGRNASRSVSKLPITRLVWQRIAVVVANIRCRLTSNSPLEISETPARAVQNGHAEVRPRGSTGPADSTDKASTFDPALVHINVAPGQKSRSRLSFCQAASTR